MNVDKELVAIGPYINYTSTLLSDETIQQLKEQMGKTLLVFPSHSIDSEAASYNIESFINELENIRNGYDTILVCLFWVDALNNTLVEKYNKMNYRLCTAGHLHDTNFLSRLRSIIELSDFTVSNNVGTHVGYCISLGKPHYIFRNNVSRVLKHKKEYFSEESRMPTFNTETKEVYEAFSSLSNIISNQQYKVVDKYWGLSQLKTPNELKDILTETIM